MMVSCRQKDHNQIKSQLVKITGELLRKWTARPEPLTEWITRRRA